MCADKVEAHTATTSVDWLIMPRVWGGIDKMAGPYCFMELLSLWIFCMRCIHAVPEVVIALFAEILRSTTTGSLTPGHLQKLGFLADRVPPHRHYRRHTARPVRGRHFGADLAELWAKCHCQFTCRPRKLLLHRLCACPQYFLYPQRLALCISFSRSC